MAPQVARINGVALHAEAETLTLEELHQRAYSELLRQAAIRGGMLASMDVAPSDGVLSEGVSQAIDSCCSSAKVSAQPTEERSGQERPGRHHRECPKEASP